MPQRNVYIEPRPAEAMRVAPRRIVHVDAQVTSSALGYVHAEVVDISRLGCRVEINCRLLLDGFVTLKLPGFEPLGCRVAWSRPTHAGLAFRNPLAAAVLDLVLVRYLRPPE